MPPLTQFLGLPILDPAQNDLRVALLGISEASPYIPGQSSHAAAAPAAIRAASELFRLQLAQYDFDLAATLLADPERPTTGPALATPGQLTDLGDIPTNAGDPAGNRARITAKIRTLLEAGIAPLILGGDDSVPIPVLAAFENHAPLTILQIDAHLDWGDVVRGNPFGYGSTMRRASEMPWVRGMVQIGMRGLGSGTADQLDDARAWGSHIVPMPELRRHGLAAALDHLPEGGNLVVSIDCDGLDPSILPAVNMPTPGGLDMVDLTTLLIAAAARCRLIAATLVELAPDRDPTGLSATTAARIALTLMGLLARA